MQFAVTLLGQQSNNFLTDVLKSISDCGCTVSELRASHFSQLTACYFLVNANWNNRGKLENLFQELASSLSIQVMPLLSEQEVTKSTGIPYIIEAISAENNQVVEEILTFLANRDTVIEDIRVNTLKSSYSSTPVLSVKVILLVPPKERLLLFREEFLDFCDNLNIDTLIEPLKR